MKQVFLKTSMVACALTLSACGGASYQAQGDVVQRSEVSMVRMAHVVAPETDNSTELSALTLANLGAFLEQNRAGYGDTILIDQGTGVDANRVEGIVKFMKARGLTMGETNGLFGGIPMDGGMTIYIERYVITNSPNCPNWSQDSRYNPNNVPTAQFGCATTNALDAAVADKRDLIDGQDGGNTNSAATKAATQHQTTGKGPAPARTTNRNTGGGITTGGQ